MFSFFGGGPDAAPHHPWRVAVGAAGHAEDGLLHQQQRRGEVQAAGAREQGAAEDHPGGEEALLHSAARKADEWRSIPEPTHGKVHVL